MTSISAGSDSETSKVSVGIRHCAFCLLTLTGEQASFCCGKCKRRAYCSKECQTEDWNPKKRGQGHKNWCGIPCGEEDIDWYIAPVPGKGLGIIAKKNIPSKFRIMVDACRPETHSEIDDLMPEGGTREQKVQLNCLGCDQNDEDQSDLTVMSLRIARANHSCNPNAGHFYDKETKVKVLFSERAIAEGEEICISYKPFNDPTSDWSPEMCRTVLKAKWNITCPADCFCRNEKIIKAYEQSRKLDEKIPQLASRGDFQGAMSSVKTLMENHAIIHSSFLIKRRTLYDGFQIGIMKMQGLKQAEQYLEELCDVISSIASPNCENLQEYLAWKKNPRTHRNYLIL